MTQNSLPRVWALFRSSARRNRLTFETSSCAQPVARLSDLRSDILSSDIRAVGHSLFSVLSRCSIFPSTPPLSLSFLLSSLFSVLCSPLATGSLSSPKLFSPPFQLLSFILTSSVLPPSTQAFSFQPISL